MKAIFFAQTTSTGVFVGQGNDIPGTLRLTYAGAIYDVEGRIAWQIKNRTSNGSGTELFGFIPDVGQNVSIGSLTVTSNSNLGLTIYAGPTLAQIKPLSSGNSDPSIDDGEDVKGDASNVGVLDALNAYLAANEAYNASGPISVDSQTTSDTTPVITGEVSLNAGNGEYLVVIIDNKIYTTSNGLTLSGNQWSIQVPDLNELSLQTYSVEAQIFNSGGWLLSDSTNNELTIISQTATLNQLSVTKTVDRSALDDGATVGDQLVFTVTAENTGNTSLYDLTVVDVLSNLNGNSQSISLGSATLIGSSPSLPDGSVLQAGDKLVYSYTHSLVQSDIDSGQLSNLATFSLRTVEGDASTGFNVESSSSGNIANGIGNGTSTDVVLA